MINVYTIVWNSEKILPYFLQHYEKYANRIFIIDDHSTDLTPVIATKHPLVTYSLYKGNCIDEDLFNQTFYDMYKSHNSDWAVVVDADEFIDGLETLGHESPGVLKTTAYTMVGKTGKLDDCKAIRTPRFDKPCVFDPKLDMRFGVGRHTCNLPARPSKLILKHYKYPSREWYVDYNTKAYPRFMNERDCNYRLKKGLAFYDANV